MAPPRKSERNPSGVPVLPPVPGVSPAPLMASSSERFLPISASCCSASPSSRTSFSSGTAYWIRARCFVGWSSLVEQRQPKGFSTPWRRRHFCEHLRLDDRAVRKRAAVRFGPRAPSPEGPSRVTVASRVSRYSWGPGREQLSRGEKNSKKSELVFEPPITTPARRADAVGDRPRG